ncbi:uncharacterized protein SOCE26_011390 [Sorangium cellulosum]|uniref:Type I restriction modification DNA specificity domain-containing protein n=1 Tax=Sorangium cellulosum TaxID=56 RepID=A0A2L0EKD2_SORCE|nr:hypothetical protein [Sorangium cellulosum]AUX39744.1 uncharacterized protein SOCE26_011390 [Sorangium cellulosum]
MRVGSVNARDVIAEGARLNGGFHLAEDQQAWRVLSAIPSKKKTRVEALCRDRGVFRGPIFTRTFCTDPKLGRSYVSPAELERAEIHSDRYLAASHGELLSELELRRGMVLVTCSGMSLGRAIMVRGSMNGFCASHDLIRIEANPEKIPLGYLYAFLRSRHGYVAMRRQIYGGNIKHIEPQHVAAVAVPRIGDAFERQVGKEIDESTKLLDSYERTVAEATRVLFESVGLVDISAHQWHAGGPDLGFVVDGPNVKSLRALNYNPRYTSLVELIKRGPWRALGDLCIPGGLRRGGRFKRIDALPEHGTLLVGQKQLFWLKPEGRWIARREAGSDVFVPAGTVLVPAQGTLGETELFCRAEFAWGAGLDIAYSEHVLRIIADESKLLRGCLFAFMRSETAFRLLRSLSVGTKLQDHHYAFRPALPIPFPPRSVQEEVHRLVVAAYEARHRAVALENEAIARIEHALEEVAS